MKRVSICCCVAVLLGLTAGCAPSVAVRKGVVLGPGSNPTVELPLQQTHQDDAAPIVLPQPVSQLKPQPIQQRAQLHKPARVKALKHL